MSDDVATAPAMARAKAALIAAIVFVALSVPLTYWFFAAGFASAGEDAIGYFVTMNLFAAQDIWAGPVMALVLAVAWRWGGVGRIAARPIRVSLAVPALAVFAVAASFVLRFFAHHNFALSLDEFMPTFQAEIFRSGAIMAPLSDRALAVHESLQPFFAYVDEERQVWIQHYRPIHAGLLSLFPAGLDQAFLHAILTGITVLALADIAKRVFPDRPGAPILVVLLLLASPQVLLTSASGFAFTTHLAFNTVWLALFLRGSWGAHIGAALVGFFALGIHQVHVHAFYVFPFGIAMLLGYFGARWKALPYVVAYGIGVPVWIMWPEIATWLHTGDASALPRHILEVEYIANYINFSGTVGSLDREYTGAFLVVNIWRFMLWLSPAVVLLIALAVIARPRLGLVPVVAAIGFVFTLVMSHLMLPNQMHTIGSRYYHPVVANVILVAAATYYAFWDDARLRRAVAVALVAGAVIFLPWRSWQIHEKVGPRAEMQARLEAMDVDSVVIDTVGVWFMPDFVRNSPFLSNRPVFYGSRGTAPALISEGPSVVIRGSDLVELGFPRGTLLEPALDLNSR